MKSLLLSVCLLALSSFSSARCPGRGGMQDWEDQELFILANEIEEDDRGSQKLSWRHFDRSCDYDAQHTYRGGLGIYYYDSSDPVTGHTEFQMMRDRRFLEAADTPGYMFIWSTQAPCVFGSRASGREACSDAVPPFLAQFRRTKFIFGFSSRRFGRHEYRAMVLDGRDTDWNGFADILREKWGGSRNANLLAYDGDRSFRVNQWLELAFLERNAVVSFSAAERLFHLRNKLGKSERMSKALAEPASAPKDGSTDEVLPAHKKVLVHVVEGGKKFPLSFVLGKEDGTIVGQVAQGLAVPTPLPAGAMYIAIFANPFTDSVEQYFKLANSVASAGGRVNVVFVKTQPLVMPVAPAVLMDQQLKKTPLTKENLRLFALVGSTQVPKRIWPRKPQTPTPPPPPAVPGAPGAPKPPASPAATKGKGK